MRDLTYAKKQTCISCTPMQMVTAERAQRYEYITHNFLIDKWQITEFFSGYIVILMKQLQLVDQLMSPDMMLVDEELYAFQA
ncbi:hypothetical protein TNCV_1838981 [Trichonephila clavipes]|nr:hypothetical protein TNCV_1838981 [Trichonephila clavipes]